MPVNYKVYMTKDVNAWAMANGCVRVYSGLMDLMNDDEVRGVVGHEMGHVALGHTKKAMQVAYATSAARSVAASAGGVVGNLSASQLGDLSEKFVNAQFSQSQESAADDYSFDTQKKKGYNPAGLVTAFQKLAIDRWRQVEHARFASVVAGAGEAYSGSDRVGEITRS